MNLTSVLVKGVKEALDKNLVGENIETKGVKAHFQLDDSGILSISSVESTFEKTISPEEQEAEEAKEDGEKKDESIDWSKLGDTISNYFKSEGKEGEEGTDKEKAAKDFIKDTIEKDEKEKKAKEKKDEKKEKKAKIETTKTDLDTEDSRMDLPLLDGDTFEASKAKLAALDKADKERVEKETALNELQSFNFDLGDKIYQEDHESASTEAERETIQAEVSKVSDWLDEEAGVETPLEEFTSRLKVLRDMAAPIFARVREHRERPEWLDNLKQSLNHSTTFLTQSRAYIIDETPKPKDTVEGGKVIDGEGHEDGEASEADPVQPKEEKTEKVVEEEKLFKEKELEQLEKKIAEVEKWRDEKLAAQADTPLSEMPKLTVSMINSKIGDLESEVQYLIRKAKMKKAELERARLKAEADAAKAEADKKKAEKKAKKKKAKEAKEGEEEKSSSDEGEGAPPTEAPPAEELLELVPGIVWAVVNHGAEEPTRSENLRPPTVPPRRAMAREEQASLIETLLILALIHLLFEHSAVPLR